MDKNSTDAPKSFKFWELGDVEALGYSMVKVDKYFKCTKVEKRKIESLTRVEEGFYKAESDEEIKFTVIAPIVGEAIVNAGDCELKQAFFYSCKKIKGLNGPFDFLVRSKDYVKINKPLLIIREVKQHEIEAGLPQVMAEMLAVQLKEDKKKVYGALTSGVEWLFLELEDKEFKIEEINFNLNFKKFNLDDVFYIVGIIVKMIKHTQISM